ncbi:unnamed protein product [Meloidogyne enterolobii]|uniref:Uncharacterized protein n=1 Tax=Meloidogyne enterolobii TaxID=390850 RepID=A0ACB0ZRE2_MELEN
MQPDSENRILQNSNILIPSKFSKGHVDTTEEDEKVQFLMQNHHELCDLSKCMGKRINGLFICQVLRIRKFINLIFMFFSVLKHSWLPI